MGASMHACMGAWCVCTPVCVCAKRLLKTNATKTNQQTNYHHLHVSGSLDNQQDPLCPLYTFYCVQQNAGGSAHDSHKCHSGQLLRDSWDIGCVESKLFVFGGSLKSAADTAICSTEK